MAKFRAKQPPAFEAEQFDGTRQEAWRLARKYGGSLATSFDKSGQPYQRIVFTTAQGHIFADKGDWIVGIAEGVGVPCPPGVFEQTYEPVEEE